VALGRDRPRHPERATDVLVVDHAVGQPDGADEAGGEATRSEVVAEEADQVGGGRPMYAATSTSALQLDPCALPGERRQPEDPPEAIRADRADAGRTPAAPR